MSATQWFRTPSAPDYDEVELLCREVEARFGRRSFGVTPDPTDGPGQASTADMTSLPRINRERAAKQPAL